MPASSKLGHDFYVQFLAALYSIPGNLPTQLIIVPIIIDLNHN